ncbi:MAG: PKD domain-containing protein, partial [Bacteroidales bacterium]
MKTINYRTVMFFIGIFIFLNAFVQQTKAQTAAFTTTSTTTCTPVHVDFHDISVGSTSWYWDFGNSNISTIHDPGANYPLPGTYSVTFSINGGTSTATQTIYVYPKPNPTISSIVTGCAPFTTSLTANASPTHVNAFTIVGAAPAPLLSYVGAIDGAPIHTYTWNFFGLIPTVTKVVGIDANPNVLELSNLAAGIYDVLLTETDDNGCSKSSLILNAITVNPQPTADFTFAKADLCGIGNASFSGTASVTPPSTITSYAWDIQSNGSIESMLQNYTHDFTTLGYGTYSVTYTAISSLNCSSNPVTKLITFNNNIVDFSFPSIKCVGQPVTFTDASTGIVSTRLWNFGDPASGTNTSSSLSPSHIYATTGTKTVTLTLSFTDGCVMIKDTVITIGGVITDFSYSTPTSCSAMQFTSTAVPYAGTSINTYAWDFYNNSTIDATTAT